MATFQRRHANGWIATVDTATPEGFCTASAHQVGVVRARWVQQGISDLPTAQQNADAVVPHHNCDDCAGWVATQAL